MSKIITNKDLIEADPKHNMGTASSILKILNTNKIYFYEQLKNISDNNLLRFYHFGKGKLEIVRKYQENISNRIDDKFEESEIFTSISISNIFKIFHYQVSQKSNNHYEVIFRDALYNELFRCYDLPLEKGDNMLMFISSNRPFIKSIELIDDIDIQSGEVRLEISAKDLCEKLLLYSMKEFYLIED